MPRLRQTNTIITDRSQLSEGDYLAFHTGGWDGVGILFMEEATGILHILTFDEEDGLGEYVITNAMINNRRYTKIDSMTYARLELERAEYSRVHGTRAGFRTGLFHNA